MIRTRFAPSPTGYLHIGGVRTALFNWLFAKKHGGSFLLRIDDTDRKRNIDEALAPILHGFRWLGLDWDEGPEVGGDYGPYYQSERLDLYKAAALQLVASGHAYHDYANVEEIAEEREQSRAENRSRFVYSRRFMAESEDERRRFEAEGREGVVRLRMPREGQCAFQDEIRGQVSVDWALEQDHVIQRADGTCLYHLASVVDDHAMKISHVIRAEEHLSNTPRQIFIAEGLGYERPVYAHLPVVAEPGSKNKLSKRKLDRYLKHGEFSKLNARGREIADALGLSVDAETFNPVIVDFYETVGFLPEAMLNALALLGWSLDDRSEIFTRAELTEHFDLSRVSKAAASFDPAKLLSIEQRWMDGLSAGQRFAAVLPFLEARGWQHDKRKIDAVLAAAGDRITIAGDILRFGEFFASDDALVWDEKALRKRIQDAEGARERLQRFRSCLDTLKNFEAQELETTLKDFVESEGIKIGQIIHALRVAVTGKGVGLGMFETLEILGRESCLRRIDRVLGETAAEN
jgi:glutamyl-tRNA synthetase